MYLEFFSTSPPKYTQYHQVLDPPIPALRESVNLRRLFFIQGKTHLSCVNEYYYPSRSMLASDQEEYFRAYLKVPLFNSSQNKNLVYATKRFKHALSHPPYHCDLSLIFSSGFFIIFFFYLFYHWAQDIEG